MMRGCGVADACCSESDDVSIIFACITRICAQPSVVETAARLAAHLYATHYEQLVIPQATKAAELRQAQEAELSAVLSTPMAGCDGDVGVVVRSSLLKSVIEKHEQQISAMVQAHKADVKQSEGRAREQFLSFLLTATKDLRTNGEAAPLRQDAEGNHNANTKFPAMIDFTREEQVPLIALLVENPLKTTVIGARPKDPVLSSIVIEVSPLSSLLSCCAMYERPPQDAGSGDVSAPDREAAAVRKFHAALCRLGANRNSAVLYLGSREEYEAFVAEHRSYNLELILPTPKVDGLPQANCECMIALQCATNMWGGTFLLWLDPLALVTTLHAAHGTSEDATRAACKVTFCSLLNSLVAWSVDSLTVAMSASTSNASHRAMRCFTGIVDAIATCQLDAAGLRISSGSNAALIALGAEPSLALSSQLMPLTLGKKHFNLSMGIRLFLYDAVYETLERNTEPISTLFGRAVQVADRRVKS